MILPNLEYCCSVVHGCGKGNEEELERLQARAARIVLKTGHLSNEDMASGLGWCGVFGQRPIHFEHAHLCAIPERSPFESKT